jgi:hypothetical protein
MRKLRQVQVHTQSMESSPILCTKCGCRKELACITKIYRTWKVGEEVFRKNIWQYEVVSIICGRTGLNDHHESRGEG